MKMKYAVAVIAAVSLLTAPVVSAIENVTINDPLANATFNGGARGVGLEDNETETGTISNQTWDLEAFTFDASTKQLNLIAGFDMKSGVGYYNTGSAVSPAYPMGDIFIRTGARVFSAYDTGANSMSGASWDYVIHFTAWPAGDGSVAYQVYENTGTATAKLTGGAGAAHPGIYWVYNSGGSAIGGAANGTYDDNATAVEADVVGAQHDILSVNLGFLDPGTYYLHSTMLCGNDVIHGKLTVPDGGLTLILLGMSLTGLALFPRKKN